MDSWRWLVSELRLRVQGFAAGDPVESVTKAGNAVASFSLAVAERRQNAEGRWEDVGEPTWVRVVGYGLDAAVILSEVTKGTRLEAEGRGNVRLYDRKDGTPGLSVELVVSTLVVSKAKPAAAAVASAEVPY